MNLSSASKRMHQNYATMKEEYEMVSKIVLYAILFDWG